MLSGRIDMLGWCVGAVASSYMYVTDANYKQKQILNDMNVPYHRVVMEYGTLKILRTDLDQRNDQIVFFHQVFIRKK